MTIEQEEAMLLTRDEARKLIWKAEVEKARFLVHIRLDAHIPP